MDDIYFDATDEAFIEYVGDLLKKLRWKWKFVKWLSDDRYTVIEGDYVYAIAAVIEWRSQVQLLFNKFIKEDVINCDSYVVIVSDDNDTLRLYPEFRSTDIDMQLPGIGADCTIVRSHFPFHVKYWINVPTQTRMDEWYLFAKTYFKYGPEDKSKTLPEEEYGYFETAGLEGRTYYKKEGKD